MSKLLECYVAPKDVTLRVSGDLEIESISDRKTYEISYLKIEEVKADGTTIPYIVTGETWAGIKYTIFDVADALILTLINNPQTKDIEYSYIAPSVKEFVDTYKKIAVQNGKIEIPEMLLIEPYDPPYTLDLATDSNAYYHNENGDMVMTSTTTGEIVASIDAFVESGLLDTIRNIVGGTEKVLYGDYQQIQKDMGIEIDDYDLDE